MSNFFNQFFIKRIYKGPSAHFVKPKVLNIRYSGNILPNYTYLNLEDIFTATPELVKLEDATFSLKLNIIKTDNSSTTIELGLFKSEKLAKEAYVKTINAFFSPSLSLFKTFLIIAIAGAALQVTTSYVMGISQAMKTRNVEIAKKAQQELERQARVEMFKMQEKMKKENPSMGGLGGLNMNPNLPSGLPPVVAPSQNRPNRETPNQINIDSRNQFNDIHQSLDDEIRKIREGKESGKIESPADILLKELKNQ